LSNKELTPSHTPTVAKILDKSVLLYFGKRVLNGCKLSNGVLVRSTISGENLGDFDSVLEATNGKKPVSLKKE
jgi:hypothetical protein